MHKTGIHVGTKLLSRHNSFSLAAASTLYIVFYAHHAEPYGLLLALYSIQQSAQYKRGDAASYIYSAHPTLYH